MSVTTTKPKFSPQVPKVTLVGVESARGVAASLVVLYHAGLHIEAHVGGRIFHGVAHFGHAGVDFFFVLSGFIITFVHHRDFGRPQRLGHYVQRRFTRVFPFYWIVLAYYLADLWLFHRAEAPGVRETVFNILLLPHSKDPVVGGAWTLVFEVMFYTAMAVSVCNRLAGAIVMGVWAVLILSGLAGADWVARAYVLRHLSSPFCLEFFLGIATAYFLLTRKVSKSSLVLAIGIAAFALAGVAEISGFMNGYAATARVVYGGCSVAIVLGLVERERSGLLQVPRPMAAVGQASYSVYLVHLIAIGIAFKYLSKVIHFTVPWSWVLWLSLFVLAVTAGVAASRWLEQPSIRFCRRLLAR